MDRTDDRLDDLTPLEQRRMNLRAFADRVLEAIEALPLPKTALDGERTVRAITAADRMLIQVFGRVTPPPPNTPHSTNTHLPRPVAHAFMRAEQPPAAAAAPYPSPVASGYAGPADAPYDTLAPFSPGHDDDSEVDFPEDLAEDFPEDFDDDFPEDFDEELDEAFLDIEGPEHHSHDATSENACAYQDLEQQAQAIFDAYLSLNPPPVAAKPPP